MNPGTVIGPTAVKALRKVVAEAGAHGEWKKAALKVADDGLGVPLLLTRPSPASKRLPGKRRGEGWTDVEHGVFVDVDVAIVVVVGFQADPTRAASGAPFHIIRGRRCCQHSRHALRCCGEKRESRRNRVGALMRREHRRQKKTHEWSWAKSEGRKTHEWSWAAHMVVKYKWSCCGRNKYSGGTTEQKRTNDAPMQSRSIRKGAPTSTVELIGSIFSSRPLTKAPGTFT